MPQIALRGRGRNEGLLATVDEADWPRLAGFRWYAHRANGSRTIYAKVPTASGWVFMHQMVLGVRAGKEIDHVNGDGLDNRQDNLRHVTHRTNMKESQRRLREDRARLTGEDELTLRAWIAEHS